MPCYNCAYTCMHTYSNCVCFKKVSGVLFLFCFFPKKDYFSKEMTKLGPDKMARIDPSFHGQAAKHNYTP